MKKTIKTSVMNTASAVDVAAAQRHAVDGAVSVMPQYQAVVGLDLGDRQSHYCVLDLSGGVVAEGVVKTTEASLRVLFEGKGRMRSCWRASRMSGRPSSPPFLRGRPRRRSISC